MPLKYHVMIASIFLCDTEMCIHKRSINCWMYLLFRFPNLGIQCVTKKEIKDSLKEREQIRVDPYGSK